MFVLVVFRVQIPLSPANLDVDTLCGTKIVAGRHNFGAPFELRTTNNKPPDFPTIVLLPIT